jgi:hypothetical protein
LVAEVTNQSLGHGAANSRHAISSRSRLAVADSESAFRKDYCKFCSFAR